MERGDVGMFGAEDRSPECRSWEDFEDELFILQLGKPRPRERSTFLPRSHGKLQ